MPRRIYKYLTEPVSVLAFAGWMFSRLLSAFIDEQYECRCIK
jgi:hypothetical protein